MTIGNEEVRDCPGSKGIQGVGEEGGSAYVAGDVVKNGDADENTLWRKANIAIIREERWNQMMMK